MASHPFGVQVVGLVWYREGDYPKILCIMADAQLLPRTYREWQEKAESAERRITRQGTRVVRAMIDPDTFADWCRARGLNIDAQARTRFANEEARRIGRG